MPIHRRRAVSLLSMFLIGLPGISSGPAAAQAASPISTYTSTADKDCQRVGGKSSEGGRRTCRGPAGLMVPVSEDDLRETVSAGRTRKLAESEPTARAGFDPFNSTTPTIEWRHAGRDSPPLAMIQRWHLADTEDDGKDGRPKARQLLVVARLPPGPVCHIAYIDVSANPNANDLARQAADTVAGNFKCGTDKVRVIGASGRAIKLARPE